MLGFGKSSKAEAPAQGPVTLGDGRSYPVAARVDCIGDSCPRPQLMTKKAVAAAPAGSVVETLVDNPTSMEALPPMLVIHHRNDTCRVTLPALVPAFQQWAGNRARVVWLDGGHAGDDPCDGSGHHGFAGIDGRMTSAVLGFARGIRAR